MVVTASGGPAQLSAASGRWALTIQFGASTTSLSTRSALRLASR